MLPNEILEKIEKIINKDIDATLKTERSAKAYDNPNWAYKQAHVNGYLKALTNIQKYIDQCKKESRVDRLTTTPDGTETRPYEVIS